MRQAPEFVNEPPPVVTDFSITFAYVNSGDNPDELQLSISAGSSGKVLSLWKDGDDVRLLSSSYTDSPLQPGTLYSYTLTNSWKKPAQTLSTVLTLRTTGDPPSLPSSVAPTVSVRQAYAKTLRNSNRIDIAWSCSQDYTSYQVRWFPAAEPSDSTQQSIDSGGLNGLSTIGPTQPKIKYDVGVQGYGTGGYGPWGSIETQAVDNTHSLATFLSQSGVSGTGGIRQYIGDSQSLRQLLGVG